MDEAHSLCDSLIRAQQRKSLHPCNIALIEKSSLSFPILMITRDSISPMDDLLDQSRPSLRRMQIRTSNINLPFHHSIRHQTSTPPPPPSHSPKLHQPLRSPKPPTRPHPNPPNPPPRLRSQRINPPQPQHIHPPHQPSHHPPRRPPLHTLPFLTNQQSLPFPPLPPLPHPSSISLRLLNRYVRNKRRIRYSRLYLRGLGLRRRNGVPSRNGIDMSLHGPSSLYLILIVSLDSVSPLSLLHPSKPSIPPRSPQLVPSARFLQ